MFVDNYYTLPILFTDLYQLYQLHTGASGTAHYRSGILDANVSQTMELLSSVHSVNEVEIGHNDHATGHPITKPEIVHEYNNKYSQQV